MIASRPDPKNPRRLLYAVGNREWTLKRLMSHYGVSENAMRHRLATWTDAAILTAPLAGERDAPAIPRYRDQSDPTGRRRLYTLGGYSWTLDLLARCSGVNERTMVNRLSRWTEAEILDAINHRRIMDGLNPKSWR